MTAFIETALGMILIFLFTSLVVTAIQEIVASIFSLRAKALESTLKALLDGADAEKTPAFAAFKDNPLIKALYDANGSRPSYIPARSFALAVMNMAPAVAAGQSTLDAVKGWATGTDSGPVGKIVNNLITEATADAATLQKNIETWYDETMDRLTGWYKRWTQALTIAFGLLAAVLFNINAIAVWDALSSQPALREAAAKYATTISKQENPPKYEDMVKELNAMKFPIGWKDKDGKYNFEVSLLALLGWIITALAASLGSAFWFDLLKRFVQIRSAGPKPAVAEPTADPGAPAVGGPFMALTKARPALLRDRA
ncbi:MAG TPA: hypothetical protein VF744_09385 [Beijerinckiaceae bacterium]|jgi:hypothetical protein